MTFCTLLANQMTVEGQRLFLKLIHSIMLPIPTLSVWDKIMKLKLNLTGRQGCQVAGLNLNMSVVPRSLCVVEVTLYILISKWCMLYNKQKAELLQPVPLLDILRPSWVIIVDVMNVPKILKLPDHSSCTLSGWWSATMRVAWSLTVILSSNWITRHVRRGQQRPHNLHSIQTHA